MKYNLISSSLARLVAWVARMEKNAAAYKVTHRLHAKDKSGTAYLTRGRIVGTSYALTVAELDLIIAERLEGESLEVEYRYDGRIIMVKVNGNVSPVEGFPQSSLIGLRDRFSLA